MHYKESYVILNLEFSVIPGRIACGSSHIAPLWTLACNTILILIKMGGKKFRYLNNGWKELIFIYFSFRKVADDVPIQTCLPTKLEQCSVQAAVCFGCSDVSGGSAMCISLDLPFFFFFFFPQESWCVQSDTPCHHTVVQCIPLAVCKNGSHCSKRSPPLMWF